jgi:hypothetical protein
LPLKVYITLIKFVIFFLRKNYENNKLKLLLLN